MSKIKVGDRVKIRRSAIDSVGIIWIMTRISDGRKTLIRKAGLRAVTFEVRRNDAFAIGTFFLPKSAKGREIRFCRNTKTFVDQEKNVVEKLNTALLTPKGMVGE